MTISSSTILVADLLTYRPKTRLFLASFLFAGLFLVLGGCTRKDIEVSFHGQTMGTTYNVKLVALEGRLPPDGLERAVDALLHELNRVFSTYIPDSEINRFNRYPVREPFDASDSFWEVLLIAEHVHRLSEGGFDPTVGPLVDLWGFGPRDTAERIPSDEEIYLLRQRLGFSKLQLTAPSRVTRNTDIAVDLSAIAKGYAARRVGEMLSSFGINNYLVELGGELQAAGHNAGGDKWRVAVETPELLRGSVQQVIALDGQGIATSGDYRNYFEKDDQRYSHTIDPRTGRPVSHSLASVTVIDDDATVADGLATGFMVLGEDQSLAIANKKGIPIYLLVKTPQGFESRHSDAFEPFLN